MKRIVLLSVVAVLGVACERDEKKKADVPREAPSADEILEAHVTAMGGRDAFAKVDALRVTAEMTIEKYGVRGTVVVTQKRPNLTRSRFEMEGVGVNEEGCDGTTCWEKSDAEGVRILQGEELQDDLRDAMLDSDLRWRELYEKVEVVGAVDFAGRGAWKVVLTPAAGEPETVYFDRETHLELGSEQLSRGQAGEARTTSRYLAWGTFGPIKQPREGVVTGDGVEIRLRVKDVEINPALPAGFFDLPPEVKALRDGAP